MVAIVTIHVWRMLPFSTVILLAGLTSIPNEVREAAAIDGAGMLARIFQVEIPMMRPILTVAVLFGVVFTFTDMSVVYLLTRGGPYNSTHVLASLAFQDGVLGGDVGGERRWRSSWCRCWWCWPSSCCAPRGGRRSV